jgi:class 3 adenylate cyclase
MLGVADSTVSTHHCVIVRDPQGRCFVRDTSRNGTRIDQRRLVPGAEVELRVGQVLSVGRGIELRLEGPAPVAAVPPPPRRTEPVSGLTRVTVLVGDIQGYTGLVHECGGEALQRAVSAVFRRIEARVAELGGTVKEYPGDAMLAYWEGPDEGACAVRACRAALALEAEARALAADPAAWDLPDHPLRMDWALATGDVVIGSLGGDHPLGLTMVGEPVVLAYRIEKLAGPGTGAILACARTAALAGHALAFRPLGPRALDGFVEPRALFALEGER